MLVSVTESELLTSSLSVTERDGVGAGVFVLDSVALIVTSFETLTLGVTLRSTDCE